MSYIVRELPRAMREKETIFRWLHERSPAGAASWLRAYDSLMDRLRRNADLFGEAPESQSFEIELKQALFKTRRGHFYRALFFIENDAAYILSVRGPGQDFLSPDEIS